MSEEQTNKQSLREKAESHKGKSFCGIESLEKIPVDIDTYEVTKEKKNPAEGEEKTFTITETVIDGKKVRVPNSVLEQLQSQLSEIQDLKFFKVTAKGEGFNKSYTVIPLLG